MMTTSVRKSKCEFFCFWVSTMGGDVAESMLRVNGRMDGWTDGWLVIYRVYGWLYVGVVAVIFVLLVALLLLLALVLLLL